MYSYLENANLVARYSSRAALLSSKGIQHAADFVQFFARGRLRRQGSHQQASGGTAERPFQKVARDLPLGLLLRCAGLVDVRSEALAASEQALFCHQLHCLQRSGVVFAEFVVDFPDGRYSQHPENGETIEL